VRVQRNARSVAELSRTIKLAAEIMPTPAHRVLRQRMYFDFEASSPGEREHRIACALQSPGGLSVGTFTSAARKFALARELSVDESADEVAKFECGGGRFSCSVA